MPLSKILILLFLTYSNIKLTFNQSNEIEPIEFEHMNICCASCDSTTYDKEKKSCKLITENLTGSCRKDIKCESHALLRTIKATKVPGEKDMVLISWLSKYRNEVSLKTRFIDFKLCQRIGEVQKFDYKDEIEVTDFLNKINMTDEYGVNLDDFDCYKDLCEFTITKKVSLRPPTKKLKTEKPRIFHEDVTICVALCGHSDNPKECHVLPTDRFLTWPEACKIELKSDLSLHKPHSFRIDRMTISQFLRFSWLNTPKECLYQEFDITTAKSKSEVKRKQFSSQDDALRHMDQRYSIKDVKVYDDEFLCLGITCHITIAWKA